MPYRSYWKGNYGYKINDKNDENSQWCNRPILNFNGKNEDWLYIINCLSYAFIEIENDKIKVLSDAPFDIFKQLEDPRIFKFKDEIYLYLQGLKQDTISFNSKVINCKKDVCVTPSLYKVKINNLSIDLEPIQLNLCHDISKRIEKNWTPYEYNNDLFFIYDLTEEKVFKFATDSCDIYKPGKPDTLVKKLISKVGKPSFKLSGGTPLVEMTNPDYGPYLGVGHIKMKISEFKELFPTFQEIEPKFLMHHSLVYFMFFYTYDHTNTKVTKISKMFICHSGNEGIEPYLLQFPCGIEYINGDILVSYGEGDDRCKLLKIKLDDIKLYDTLDSIPSSSDLFELIYDTVTPTTSGGNRKSRKQRKHRNRKNRTYKK